MFDAGPVTDFPPGSVVTFADGEEIERSTPTESTGDHLFGSEIVFHLVRLDDGDFLALDARDTHSDCWVAWQPDLEFPRHASEQFARRLGWFRDPCHGAVYDVTGLRAFGPAPRDLDRFPVELRDGRVLVTLVLDALILGESRVGSVGDATPEPAATPAATEPPARSARDVEMTEVVRYVPQVSPAARTELSTCWESIAAPWRDDAWRCITSGGAILDPCFQFEGRETGLLCGPNPATGTPGVLATLAEPAVRSTPVESAEGRAWLFELDDGSVCTPPTGTTGQFGGRLVTYFCTGPVSWIVGDLLPGRVWRVEVAGTEADGAVVFETVAIRTVWQ